MIIIAFNGGEFMSFKNNVLVTNKELRTFCIQRFLFGISYSFMIPIIPLYLSSLGVVTMTVGIIMSLYGVAKAISQLLFGRVSDILGDKRVLVVILFIMSFVPALYTFIQGKVISGVIYVIQGAILGMAAPATFSILSRSIDDSKRGQCTGYASAVFTLGGGIGAAISGFILSKFNNYNIIFYMSAIGIFLTNIYIMRKIKKQDNKSKKEKVKLKEVFIIIKKNKLLCKIITLGSIAFLGDFIFGCVGALFPFYSQEVLNAGVGYACTIISVYLFVFGIGAPIAGISADKIGNNKQLIISFIVMSVTLFGLTVVKNIPLFTAIIIVYFIGATFLNASLQSVLSEFGGNEEIKGVVFGFVGASEAAGYAVGPIVSAYIYGIRKDWLFLCLLVVSLTIFALYLLLRKKACIDS